MLNSVLNGDWSNSVPGRKIPEGHSGWSLAWNHVCGDIDHPCGVIADFCVVINDPCGVIADPCGVIANPCRVIANPCAVVVIPEAIGDRRSLRDSLNIKYC